jgi:hypothetical protein
MRVTYPEEFEVGHSEGMPVATQFRLEL